MGKLPVGKLFRLVEEVLLNLNPNKAAGPDGVESKLLKECATEMAPILCHLFRKSMYEGEVPRNWKEAPNPQKGQQSNYGKLSSSCANLDNVQNL